MRKRAGIIALAVMLSLAALLIWRLDLPHWKKLDISRLTDMPGTTLVYDADGMPAGAIHGAENRIWVSLDQVPEDVQRAFLAAEDIRFYRHHGVDLYRMFGALWHDIRTLSYAQGASTITQQLIKLTHLSQAKTLSRKAQEIFLALKLEKQMTKSQILEAYLNAVYFGHGAYGIETASRVYFDKPASHLTLAEGALLAGIIKSPTNYAPHLNGKRAVDRRNSILDTMEESGFITSQQREEAQAEALQLTARVDIDATDFAWYTDAVLAEAQSVLNLSADEVISGSYRIYTGLKPGMQETAEALFDADENFPDNAEDGTPVQAAVVVLDAASGEVQALVGGRNYDVRRGLNRVTQTRRQPGSAFKPVSTYAAAIDAYGYLPTSVIDDTPRSFSGGYAPRNAGGKTYGSVTLRQALSRSLNIATVGLAEEVGLPAIRTYAARFGLQLSPQDVNLSLSLGALTEGVSPAQLGAAYCALANGGTRVDAHLIREIVDSSGQTVYRTPDPTERAVSSVSSYMITDMLKTAATTGSARALAACGLPVAGKTGTATDGSGNTRDVWTVAYTPDTTMVVWMGFDRPDANHVMPAAAGGGGYPARLCASFIQKAKQYFAGSDFKRPAGVKTALLDSLALEEDHAALLSTERTPAGFTTLELFHDYDMPRQFSANWSIPSQIADFRMMSGEGECPVLAFTVLEDTTEYLLVRTDGEETREIATLRGEPGQEIRYADVEHDLSRPADYALLPRNALLYENGVLLTGPQSVSVHYAPGGLLNVIMGVGAAIATPTPTAIDDIQDQSLFS